MFTLHLTFQAPTYSSFVALKAIVVERRCRSEPDSGGSSVRVEDVMGTPSSMLCSSSPGIVRKQAINSNTSRSLRRKKGILVSEFLFSSDDIDVVYRNFFHS